MCVWIHLYIQMLHIKPHLLSSCCYVASCSEPLCIVPPGKAAGPTDRLLSGLQGHPPASEYLHHAPQREAGL